MSSFGAPAATGSSMGTKWCPPVGGDTDSVKPKTAFGGLLGASREQKIDKKLKKRASGGFLEETSQKARVCGRSVATAILENDAPV